MNAEDVLRHEFSAEPGSFLLQLRCDLHWDPEAVERLTKAMETYAATARKSADRDAELVRALVPHWYAMRRWAEELLVRALGLRGADEILKPEHRGRKYIPGSLWIYRTHGVGVDIDRGLASGGIDFDFDKPAPDPWRLRIFAEKQLNAGNLPPLDYLPLVDDKERFERAAKTVLAETEAG